MTGKSIVAFVTALVALVIPALGRAADSPSVGDFVHAPAFEQKVNTPLPVYVEYPAGTLGRVFLKYSAARRKTWSRVELTPVGHGWGGVIPCRDVTSGEMRYWVQGFDTHGESVASSADPLHPFVVPIRSSIASKPPHLPGQAAPHSCVGPRAAESHVETTEVPAPESAPAPTPAAELAPISEPAPASEPADEALAPDAPSEPVFARWWIGVTRIVDFLSLPAATDLCALSPGAAPVNRSGYYCTNPDGSDFPARNSTGATQNATLMSGQSGQTPGGLQAGNARALLSVDYGLSSNILIGARVGYVVNAYPTRGAAVLDRRAFGAHIHLEARGTYVFGSDPLAHTGFAPVAFGALGISEFDGHTTRIVSLESAIPGRVPVSQPVNVWLTNGPWFAAAGGGARYQFSARAEFTAAVRINAAVGGAGALVTYGPEIGFQYAF